MIDLPIPPDERGRLRTLQRVGAMDARSDGFAEEAAIAAASIAGAPTAYVTLIGADFQRVKASCGPLSGDGPREASFCTHAVVGVVPLIVENLLKDERFRAHPLVVGPPFARFYAGFPLVVSGHALGAVCVIDDRPRQLTSDQARRLGKLAAGVAAWFALPSQRAPSAASKSHL